MGERQAFGANRVKNFGTAASMEFGDDSSPPGEFILRLRSLAGRPPVLETAPGAAENPRRTFSYWGARIPGNETGAFPQPLVLATNPQTRCDTQRQTCRC